MLFTYIVVFIVFVLIAILGLYMASVYLFPRKLDEIAEMIKKGQTRLAIKKLEQIIEKDDHDVYAHYLMGEAFLKENNNQFAVVEYRQVLKYAAFSDKVNEKEVHVKLAKIFKEQKKPNEAKNELLVLTKLDPNNFEHYYELGIIFFDMGTVEKSLPYFKKSVDLNPKNTNAHYYLGQVYYRTGNHADAKTSFLEAIKLEQSNYKSHYFLGLVLRHLGDYEWAIKEFDVAQKNDEIKPKCFLAKGTCYLERELYPKAIIEFERGLKSVSRGSDTELNMRYFLADAYEKSRDIHSAIENWEKIFEVNKKFRDVEQKLKQNEELRQDDHVKDFLIATLATFEHLCRKLVEQMGLDVQETKVISDTEIEIFAAEPDDKRRNTRRNNKIIRILRSTETINDVYIRRLHETMKPRNAQRVVIITTGDFSQAALEFANTRPVELYGKSHIIDMLRSIRS